MEETQETLRQEDPLEEEMATHSSILAWKIPWTEEQATVPRDAKSQTWLRIHTHTASIIQKFESGLVVPIELRVPFSYWTLRQFLSSCAVSRTVGMVGGVTEAWSAAIYHIFPLLLIARIWKLKFQNVDNKEGIPLYISWIYPYLPSHFLLLFHSTILEIKVHQTMRATVC